MKIYGDLFDMYRENPVKACRTAIRKTAHINNVSDRMEEINKMLGMYGVEAINGEKYVSHYWQNCVALYANAGDTYTLTVLIPTNTGRPIVTTWGDWVERNERKYGIL